MKPIMWMRAIRDAEPKPSPMRLLALLALALRMRPDGSGFASTRQLANDAGVDERTVKRATKWARDADYLIQTRRGHRISAEVAIASEWRLTAPTQGDTGDTLEGDPRGQNSQPKGTANGTQGDTGDTPRGLLPEVFIQERARAGANGAAASNGHRPNDDLDLDKTKNCKHLKFTVEGDCLACGALITKEIT